MHKRKYGDTRMCIFDSWIKPFVFKILEIYFLLEYEAINVMCYMPFGV